MKPSRIVVALFALAIALVVAVAPVSAQITNPEALTSSFTEFSNAFAKSLPLNATIGLNWSDAYIGRLLAIPPNLGVGVTVGATTVPGTVFQNLASSLGLTDGFGDTFDAVVAQGLPVPGYALDARIGGIFLPFDAGVKFGHLPESAVPLAPSVRVSYTNIGADVRLALLTGPILPKLSVGIGYSYLAGSIAAPLGIGATTIGSYPLPDNSTVTVNLSDPALALDWSASVIDVKAQLSQSFLIVEPHVGIGASYGFAATNAGLSTTVTATDGSGNPVDIATLEEVAGVTINGTGISVATQTDPALAFRVFGGASLNFIIFRLDLGAMYNLTSGALGATIGARVQL